MTALDAPNSDRRDTALTVNPWVALSVVLAATVMVALDTTIVNIALHRIGVDLHAGEGDVEWLVTAYLLAVCASQPATGWLANRFGRKRTFLVALAVFTIASAACGAAPSLGVLVACRLVQGLGGGAIMPVGMTMVLESFPKERHGRALSVWGMAVMIAPAIGPTIGGWVVTSVSWHWLFLVNLPIGIVVFALGVRLIPDSATRLKRPFDAIGLVLGGAGLALFVLGLSQGGRWGWIEVSTTACIASGAVLLAVFIRHELATDHPLLEVRMFGDTTFALAMGAYLFLVGAQFARLVYLPLELQGLRGFTALRVGMMLVIPAIVAAVGVSLGGRIVDRIGPRRPILIGGSLVAIALVGLSRLDLDTSEWAIVAIASLQGLGFGLTQAPTLVAGISELPKHLVAQASAVRSLIGQVAAALSVAVIGAVVSSRMGDHPTREHAQSAYNSGFLAGGIGVVIAIVLAWRLPRRGSVNGLPEDLALVAE